MSILTFPEVKVEHFSWSLESNTQVFRSPLNGATQTVELPGARWKAELSFGRLGESDKRVLAAFMARLRGRAGQFYLSEPGNKEPRGVLGGVPVVNTTLSDTPTAIGVSGWNPNVSGVLKAGDMIGFASGDLKIVVEDVDSDGNGDSIVRVEPPCRTQPVDGALMITNSPTCVMRLTSDSQTAWTGEPPLIYSMSFSCEEAIV